MTEQIDCSDDVKTNKSIDSAVCKYFDDELFDDIPKTSEYNYYSPVWEQVIKKSIKIQNLLDVGCGTGVFSASLKSKITGKLIGVDASAFALEQAKNNGFDDTYMLEDFCSQPLPFGDESVDFVLCKDVFEHLLDPLYLLSEIRRVLTPAGYLLATVPNHFPLKGRLKFLFTNDLDTFRYFPSSKVWNFPHLRFFSYDSFVEFLEQQNFKLVENYSGLFPCIPIMGRISLHLHLFDSLMKKVATKNPTQFAYGFTLLVKK